MLSQPFRPYNYSRQSRRNQAKRLKKDNFLTMISGLMGLES